MHKFSSVYIADISSGWIINRLMSDIAGELTRRGLEVTVGLRENYSGQDVLFDSRYLTARPDERATVNSVFITHIDDRLREMELRSTSSSFNSLVCLSPHDADFVAGLIGSRASVVGIDLPARSLAVRPWRIALFSACYADGRKNESWIPDYFENRPSEYRQNFTFCFLGHDWEKFSRRLGALDINYEVHRYSRDLPGEYALYTNCLSTMDRMIYLGFDGGAMSVYDALTAGVEVIASDISYHRGLGESVRLFRDREGFYREMDALNEIQAGRRRALKERSISAYVDKLVAHWDEIIQPGHAAPKPMGAAQGEAVALFREHYKPLGPSRYRSAAIRLGTKLFRPLVRRTDAR